MIFTLFMFLFFLLENHFLLIEASPNRKSKDVSAPVTLNLKDVVLRINIEQMQKGAFLKISPVFNNDSELISTPIVNTSYVSNNDFDADEPCDHDDCPMDDDNDYHDSHDFNELTNHKNDENILLDSSAQKSIITSSFLDLALSAPGLSATSTSHWTYTDQGAWSTTYPNCAGTRQSPINLPQNPAVSIAKPCLVWTNYHSAHRYLTLENNGHSVYASSTWTIGSVPMLYGGPLDGTYKLASVHWHWGSDNHQGAEHTIGSSTSPLEMHFVHYSTRYANLAAALAASTDQNALAVVGVLFKKSLFVNPGMMILVRAMERAAMQGTQNTILPLGDLGLNFRDGYYTYPGSITSPPCNQNVRWIVLKKKLHITSAQLRVFRSILVNGLPLVNNYRNIQAINGRTVEFYQQCSG